MKRDNYRTELGYKAGKLKRNARRAQGLSDMFFSTYQGITAATKVTGDILERTSQLEIENFKIKLNNDIQKLQEEWTTGKYGQDPKDYEESIQDFFKQRDIGYGKYTAENSAYHPSNPYLGTQYKKILAAEKGPLMQKAESIRYAKEKGNALKNMENSFILNSTIEDPNTRLKKDDGLISDAYAGGYIDIEQQNKLRQDRYNIIGSELASKKYMEAKKTGKNDAEAEAYSKEALNAFHNNNNRDELGMAADINIPYSQGIKNGQVEWRQLTTATNNQIYSENTPIIERAKNTTNVRASITEIDKQLLRIDQVKSNMEVDDYRIRRNELMAAKQTLVDASSVTPTPRATRASVSTETVVPTQLTYNELSKKVENRIIPQFFEDFKNQKVISLADYIDGALLYYDNGTDSDQESLAYQQEITNALKTAVGTDEEKKQYAINEANQNKAAYWDPLRNKLIDNLVDALLKDKSTANWPSDIKETIDTIYADINNDRNLTVHQKNVLKKRYLTELFNKSVEDQKLVNKDPEKRNKELQDKIKQIRNSEVMSSYSFILNNDGTVKDIGDNDGYVDETLFTSILRQVTGNEHNIDRDIETGELYYAGDYTGALFKNVAPLLTADLVGTINKQRVLKAPASMPQQFKDQVEKYGNIFTNNVSLRDVEVLMEVKDNDYTGNVNFRIAQDPNHIWRYTVENGKTVLQRKEVNDTWENAETMKREERMKKADAVKKAEQELKAQQKSVNSVTKKQKALSVQSTGQYEATRQKDFDDSVEEIVKGTQVPPNYITNKPDKQKAWKEENEKTKRMYAQQYLSGNTDDNWTPQTYKKKVAELKAN